jgi:hypothetical protein
MVLFDSGIRTASNVIMVTTMDAQGVLGEHRVSLSFVRKMSDFLCTPDFLLASGGSWGA